MRLIRNRARLIAVMAIAWHIGTMAAIVTVLSVEMRAMTEETGAENCPLQSKTSCPLHGEWDGTHVCDCPTIGCAQTDIGLAGLFGPAGVLPVPVGMPEPIDAGEAAPLMFRSTHLLAPVPLSPPPRA